jgi:hypothetical protein
MESLPGGLVGDAAAGANLALSALAFRLDVERMDDVVDRSAIRQSINDVLCSLFDGHGHAPLRHTSIQHIGRKGDFQARTSRENGDAPPQPATAGPAPLQLT